VSNAIAATPAPVMGLHDAPMWASIRERRLRLQRCKACGTWQYPPGPGCPRCLSTDLGWRAVSGGARIVSWVVFHRQYLPAYPAPYNVIAVRLDEGPLMVSNLEGPTPEGSWIGRWVRLTYAVMPDGAVLPRFVLDGGA
jgi:uncharacterized protein